MICINCGQKQATGNFCGSCGTPFPSKHSISKSPTTSSNDAIELNPHIEHIKRKSKLFLKYFILYLKNPSHVYHKEEKEFPNGVISAILLAIVIGLSYFTITNNYVHEIYPASFLSVFSSIFIFSVASLGLVLFTLTLINNFFGPRHSFKVIVSLYGGHLPPVLLLGLISLLLLLLKSFSLGSILLTLTFLFAICILPLYLISLLLTHKSTSLDPLYGFMLYIATISVLFAIFTAFLADSTIGNTLLNSRYWF